MPPGTSTARRVGPSRAVVVGDRDVLALVPLPGRVRVGLVIPTVRRSVDLTDRPSAALTCLDRAADEARVPRAAARADLREVLDEVARDVDAWHTGADLDPTAHLGGASFPMLGAAYERGARPVAEVPRWAVAPVAAGSARAAAQIAFGDRATRPVVRQLAATLAGGAPDRPVGLAPLALALTGRSTLEPDQIVRVLRTVEEAEPGPVLTVDQLAACATVVRALGAARAERILREAAGVDGTRRLLEVARTWPDVASRLPASPPSRLTDLADRCRALVVTDPGPRPDRAVPGCREPAGGDRSGRVRRGRQDAPPAVLDGVTGRSPARRPVPDRPPPLTPGEQGGLHAPAAEGTVTPATVVPSSPRLSLLDGWEADGLRFARPRTCGDLDRWGRMLRCCIGSYGPAAVAGLSELLAIHRGSELRACLELTPTGTVRQLLGPANRAVDGATRRTVLRALVDRAGIDPRLPGNRPWYEARC